MNTKKQLKKRIADLEKECSWISVERDMLKNDMRIQLLEKKKYISEINHLKKENKEVKDRSKNWFERYNREYDRAEELEDRCNELYQTNEKLKKENEKLRKVACVGNCLNIMQDSLDLIKKNDKLEDKIDRISAVLKED